MSQIYIYCRSTTERQRLALMNELINARCLQAVQPRHEQRVLDVGAGTGQFTRLLAQHLPASSQVVAVERNPEQRDAALQLGSTQTNSPTMGCDIDFRLGDAFALPLSSAEWGSFDLAHTRFLLEHVNKVLDAAGTAGGHQGYGQHGACCGELPCVVTATRAVS